MKFLARVTDQPKRSSLFWIESALASASLLLAAVTVLVPDWIEVTLHVDPDAGSGSLEWLLALAFAGVGGLMLASAGRRGGVLQGKRTNLRGGVK